MTLPTPHEFWKDPETAKGFVPDRFVEVCSPEFYPDLTPVSDWMVDLIKEFVPDKSARILEIGCNCGRNLFYLDEAGYPHSYGIEINPNAIELSKERFPSIAGRIIDISVEDYLQSGGFDDRYFDLVYTQSCLMHIPPESDWIFKEMVRISKMLIINEKEVNTGSGMEYKFDRNYGEVFTGRGCEQIAHRPVRGVRYINGCETRVFRVL